MGIPEKTQVIQGHWTSQKHVVGICSGTPFLLEQRREDPKRGVLSIICKWVSVFLFEILLFGFYGLTDVTLILALTISGAIGEKLHIFFFLLNPERHLKLTL